MNGVSPIAVAIVGAQAWIGSERRREEERRETDRQAETDRHRDRETYIRLIKGHPSTWLQLPASSEHTVQLKSL